MISFNHLGKTYTMPETVSWGAMKRYTPLLKQLLNRQDISEKLKDLERSKASSVEISLFLLSCWLESDTIVTQIISETFRTEGGEKLPLSQVDDIPPEMGSVAVTFFLANMNGLFPDTQKYFKLSVVPTSSLT